MVIARGAALAAALLAGLAPASAQTVTMEPGETLLEITATG